MTTVPSPRRVTAGHVAAGHRCSIIMICGLLGACAQLPAEPAARAAYEEANDPAEPTNRAIFAGNQWVDRNAIRPVAQVYTDYVPDRIRSSLRNFSRNLQEPSTLVNDALQGNLSRAWVTAQRFALNSTVGGLGLFDVATDWDLPGHQADYGQTFGVWGAGPGPSVQLPLFGSSNLRDTAGRAVGMVANPLGFVSGETFQTVRAVGGAVGMVGQRADALPVTNDLERSSLDHYAAMRSLSAQRRTALVEEGRTGRRSQRTEPNAPAVDIRAHPSPEESRR